ncbi:DUF2892 domain-containing protein [Nodosilinea sp. LEGE 07088]|uniref:YgaP family membrane protein n=1 Tax=Nodosilinea sp. LEGE 07088 TaxID=2777968 RepID=UPI00187E8293|nr:DUF2892 domain-containing protein [Nodosilinea sp. LEGE 07088]MBE9136446.1 DUF2892 domain-containing protein [Nodosilinea sp. LEGE 07088]
MLNNVGTIDRLLRLIAAAVLLYLGLQTHAGSALGIGLAVVGGIALLTGLIGSCALYGLLGINTRKSNQSLS